MAIHKAKVIMVTSVKGGVGKTTTALNLAGVYSLMGKKVLILDFDLYSGGVALSLNIDLKTDMYKLAYDMSVNDFSGIDAYTVKYNDNISVIPAPKDPRYASKIETKYISMILKKVSVKWDVVIIDSNHLMDATNLILMDKSDVVLYVMNNNPVDIKNLKSMIAIHKDLEKNNYVVLLNESNSRLNEMFSSYDIKNIIKDDVNYTIPSTFYNKNINKYVLKGKILTLDKSVRLFNKNAIKEFDKLALDLLER